MIDKLKKLGAKYNLTTIQLAHFAGQLSHESFDFKITSENLNYSAERLLQVFPKYFNEKNVIIYARKPIKIANRVYANRMGNGDENSGDGYKFRGRGYIQLTGKNNYSAFSKFIGEDCVQNPDLVSQKYALESALWFFFENKIFTLCKDLSDDSIKKVTKKINGGLNGFADRKAKTLKYYNLLK
jgi:putative chitinase